MSTPEVDPAGPADPAPQVRPADPERGLRGAMSATLLLEAITILLALPVAGQPDPLHGWEIGAILGLAAAHIYGCTVVRKRWAVPFFLTLQVLLIAGWVIHPAVGIMGIVYALVWWCLLYFRNEYRRRLAAGTLPMAD